MEQKIINAYADCINALKELTPREAQEILSNLKESLEKSHNLVKIP